MNPARWLARLLPAEEREFVLGDLEEAFGSGRPIRYTLELLRAALALRRRPWALAARPASPRGDSAMSILLSDLRFGLRQLGRTPGFTALVTLTLALGIGATTAIFSVADGALFRPLPYPEAGRIVTVWELDQEGRESNTGYETFLDVERTAQSFSSVAVVSSWEPTLQRGSDPERLEGQRVTRGFFSVLGVRPELGRDFTAEENVRGKHFAVILSQGLWRRRFGGDPAVVGKPITLSGISYTVVGVMPERFESLLEPKAQLWAPLGYTTALPWACRDCRHLREVARVKDGVPLERAGRELDLISARLFAEHPKDYPRAGMIAVPLQSWLTRSARPALLSLLGAVGFVLLIACSNVSSLMLGRAMQREGEFAVRRALGAGRGRVVRQLLTESVLLSALGGIAGTGLAWVGVKLLAANGPEGLPRLGAIGLDARVLAVTTALALATGLLFGLVPALATARPDVAGALHPGLRIAGRRGRHLARGGLVVAEVAMALMLLVGAGLLLRSLGRLLAVNPGLDPSGLLTMEVQTTGPRYNSDDAAVRAFFDRAGDAVRSVPGVERAGWVSMLPLGGNFDRYGVQIEGKPLANPQEAPSADRYAISGDYLKATRIPLLLGRGFEQTDGQNAPPVVLINQTFARTGWAGEDPIGRKIQVGGTDGPWRSIVGVVGDVHHTGLDEAVAPQVYLPEAQWRSADNAMILVVRTRGDPAALARTVRSAIRSVDPDLPILHVATMEQVIEGTTQQRRFALVLFGAFALVALVLAGAGIFGVLAGSVTERTREIGIRAALGASRGGLLRLVVRQGLGFTLAGVVLGTLGALGLSRFLTRLLFGVGAQDPLTFAGGLVLLMAVAAGACWVPALRATRISPLEALRSE